MALRNKIEDKLKLKEKFSRNLNLKFNEKEWFDLKFDLIEDGFSLHYKDCGHRGTKLTATKKMMVQKQDINKIMKSKNVIKYSELFDNKYEWVIERDYFLIIPRNNVWFLELIVKYIFDKGEYWRTFNDNG